MNFSYIDDTLTIKGVTTLNALRILALLGQAEAGPVPPAPIEAPKGPPAVASGGFIGGQPETPKPAPKASQKPQDGGKPAPQPKPAPEAAPAVAAPAAPDPDKEERVAIEKENEAATPTKGWNLSGNGSAKDDGEVDLAFLKAQTKFNPILQHLIERGFDTEEKLLELCSRLKTEVPVIGRIGDLAGRIPRALEALKAQAPAAG